MNKDMQKEKKETEGTAKRFPIPEMLNGGSSPVPVEKRLSQIRDHFEYMGIAPYNGKDGSTLIVTVKVLLPLKWDIYEEENADRFKVGVSAEPYSNKSYNEVSFFIDITYGIDSLFQAILNTIDRNRKAEEKMRIFQEKADELQKMYQDSVNRLKEMFEEGNEDLDSLRNVSCNTILGGAGEAEKKPSEDPGAQGRDNGTGKEKECPAQPENDPGEVKGVKK